ncbi:hypothetical protein G7Y89_g5129 [Cudoniella acicularis]|uniref:Uncharacterized protein n=1 Tax=Cudoniella acicularis TaxID=354080 RepID=A0A8H4RPL4_9HELO|nr:hypothetical protein G7Y89_g5129 [Cudoniella acicularis]
MDHTEQNEVDIEQSPTSQWLQNIHQRGVFGGSSGTNASRASVVNSETQKTRPEHKYNTVRVVGKRLRCG